MNNRWRTAARWTGLALAGVLLAGAAGLGYVTYTQAQNLITNPAATRNQNPKTPADYGLPGEAVTVTSADGLHLAGWYIPGENGAVVMAQHGYKSDRNEMLNEAQMLHRHGYGVLVTCVRAHDRSDGEMIMLGRQELQDLDAWYQYLLTRPEVQPDRIGLLGNSFGGALAIGYAAQNPQIRAVVANSPFSSLNDTIGTSVTYFTGLPPFPFAPLIALWAEQQTGNRAVDFDATVWIKTISPRPVFLMQGGADIIVNADSGQRLFAAAGEPKELWFEPDLGHTDFDTARPEEYERRVTAFFDTYLLGRPANR